MRLLPNQIKALEARQTALENDLSNLRNQLNLIFTQLQDLNNNKVDLTQLAEFEKMIMNRLNDIVAALNNQFADKAETKKALKLLEK